MAVYSTSRVCIYKQTFFLEHTDDIQFTISMSTRKCTY